MSDLAIHGGRPVRQGPFTVRRPFGDRARENVLTALDSGLLSSVGGRFTTEFEGALTAFYGATSAVAVSSGTAAIHTAVAALDLEPGSEVIVGPITDAGSVLPLIYQGLVPVFCDLDEHLAMTPDTVAPHLTDRTRAIMAIHLFGGASDPVGLRALADRHGLILLEDCSQAHGTAVGPMMLGRFGHIGMFSLQQSKHMTSGDGGFCLTDDAELAGRMRLFRDKGWDRTGTGARAYPQLGLNYRITELQSAVALPQVDALPEVLRRRRNHAARLDAALADLPSVHRWRPPPQAECAWWCYPFLIESGLRDRFAEALAAEGVPTTVGYIGEPIQACLSATADRRTFGDSGWPLSTGDRVYRASDTPAAAAALDAMLVFWLHEDMSETEIDEVGTAIAKVATAFAEECPA